MRYPSPTDPANAPAWANYVIAQAVQASLGLIPESALAVGVAVRGEHVTLRFQLSTKMQRHLEDIADIADELSDLLGPNIGVDWACDLRSGPELDPHDGIRWIFRCRVDD